jgi:hypothetical protein
MTNADIFAARLDRIKAGAPNTKGTIFVGQDEQIHRGKRETIKPAKGAEVARNSLYPLSLLGAFGLGLLAVALGRYARFHLAGAQAQLEDADLEMALTGGIGIMLSFVLAQMFRLTSKEHKGLQAAGVFAMVCAFHNLAHWAPGPMAMAFSPDWVAAVQAEAPPNSAKFRGVYFPLFEEGTTLAAALPGDPVAEPQAGAAEAAAPVAAKKPCEPAKTTVTILQTDNAKGNKSGGAKRSVVCEGS